MKARNGAAASGIGQRFRVPMQRERIWRCEAFCSQKEWTFAEKHIFGRNNDMAQWQRNLYKEQVVVGSNPTIIYKKQKPSPVVLQKRSNPWVERQPGQEEARKANPVDARVVLFRGLQPLSRAKSVE